MFESSGSEPSTGSGAPSHLWADRHPLAASLQDAAPGAELAAALNACEVADADGAALVEGVAAWERILSWAAAAQASWIRELALRPNGVGADPVEFSSDEVAVALGVSRRAGENKVAFALGLDRSPAVHDALASGAIDSRKADLLLRETNHLSDSEASQVQADVLPRASRMTVPQLRTAIRRSELTLDLAAAAKRHERAKEERCVRMRPAPDAMAWVTAFLPADDAMRVMTAVDAIAASAAPEDARTLDARRADALVDVLTQVLDSGTGPGGLPLTTQQRRRPHLSITLDAGTWLGLRDSPGHLAGYGAVPAEMARAIAEQASERTVLTDPQTGEATGQWLEPGLRDPLGPGRTQALREARSTASYRPTDALVQAVVDRDVTCTFPGCRVPAARCDIDHIVPFDHSGSTNGPTSLENLQALCRHHHRLKTHGGWSASRDPRTGVTTWTSRTGHQYRREPVPVDPGRPPDRGMRAPGNEARRKQRPDSQQPRAAGETDAA